MCNVKRLGHLEDGRVLLECSQAEHVAFLMLADLAKGRPLPGYNPHIEGVDADLLAVFGAIQEWLLIKDKANRLRSLADEIDSAIGVTPDA
jgi:hypothetical protein